MPAIRHLQGSFFTVSAILVVIAFGAGASASLVDQGNSVQKLMERGALQEAVERADAGNPEDTYLAAQALIKMDNTGGANERYGRLRESGDESWKAIGESGAKLLEGDTGGALSAATRAVDLNGDNPYAHYQLGLVTAKQGNFQRSSQAFARSVELKPDFAYGHYYAGQAYQRLRQTPKMAEHFTVFVRLAPDSPERQVVQAILRGLR